MFPRLPTVHVRGWRLWLWNELLWHHPPAANKLIECDFRLHSYNFAILPNSNFAFYGFFFAAMPFICNKIDELYLKAFQIGAKGMLTFSFQIISQSWENSQMCVRLRLDKRGWRFGLWSELRWHHAPQTVCKLNWLSATLNYFHALLQ